MKPKKKKMKTAFVALMFALLPFGLKAQSVNLDLSYTAAPIGQASQSAAILYGTYSPNTYTSQYARQLLTDASGNLLVSGAGGGTFITGTVTTSDALSYGYLTTTAAGTAGRGGSYTAVALTGAYSMNMTFAAGVNGPGICTIYPGHGGGLMTALYWNSLPGYLAPTTALAVSTTPIMFTYGIGDFLNMSVTAAALTGTVQVRYAPIY